MLGVLARSKKINQARQEKMVSAQSIKIMFIIKNMRKIKKINELDGNNYILSVIAIFCVS